MSKKIVFIVPYYGEFPNYFREWIFTAGHLKDQGIDFLLITDIAIECELPKNISVLNTSFEDFVNRAQQKFNFKLGLTTPYKLCDFKATLGYIFQNEIQDYDFWGNCDIDQVWGNVRHFITNDILEKYDRIQFFGHFILYRNKPDINKLFMLKGAIYDYKTVLSDTMHYSFCEHSGMMKIVVENNISNYLDINYADLSPRYTRMIVSRQPNYDHQIIYWENGHVYRKYILSDNSVGTDEYMYFHFQKKHPASLECWKENRKPKRIIYRADGFIEADDIEVNADYILEYSDFKGKEIDQKEAAVYNKKKINDFIHSPMKKKILWVKQRIATKQVIKYEEYFGKNYSNV